MPPAAAPTHARPRVVAVVGPTAAGKSATALALAHALGAEIVNADAMALYRGLDVGTAKLPLADREGVPHHLLDVWELSRRASVADYQQQAVAMVSGLLAADTSVVVVGGSGLYLQALLDDLVIPPTDARIRRELESELAATSAQDLHARLARVDAAAAASILPTNARRVVRALEVVALTGSYTATLPTGARRWPGTVLVGVDRPDLQQRIVDRVKAMFGAGLVAETLALPGLADTPTASKALGYAQVLAQPEDPVAAAAATVIATRQYARRQRSWFRREPAIRWVADTGEALQLVGSS
jgi:tRNA dimethylallyltransferase